MGEHWDPIHYVECLHDTNEALAVFMSMADKAVDSGPVGIQLLAMNDMYELFSLVRGLRDEAKKERLVVLDLSEKWLKALDKIEKLERDK